ncbi:MAG TPA: hypothetical protein VK988_01250 [Acidimicrobiales bacterium]|nr:hypothetical protein [Acidimicrobiales bacterium]
MSMLDRSVETFSVSSALLFDSATRRLDASFYDAAVIEAIGALEASGMALTPIRDLTERVFIPNRFKRNYVDADHGVPFLQGSHIIQFRPDDVRYLALATHKNMDNLLISSGWLLITRSGTVGRCAIVTAQWDGWAASEHIFRVVPRPGCPVGYLATFLGSPVGQLQLSHQIYGAVVDELTVEHIRGIRVPMPVTKAQKRTVAAINAEALAAAEARASAVVLADAADRSLAMFLPQPEQPEFVPGRDDRMKIDADPEDALRAMLRTPRQG